MTRYTSDIPSSKDVRRVLLRLFILGGDIAAVAFSYGAAFLVRFYYPPFLEAFPIVKGLPDFEIYLNAFPVILFMWALAIYWQGAYKRIQLQALDDGIRMARASITGALLSMSAMFLYREASFSRLVFIMGGAIGFVFVYLVRQILKSVYVFWVKRNRRLQRVLLVSKGYLSSSITKILRKEGDRAVLKTADSAPASVCRAIERSRINEVLLADVDLVHKDAVRIATFCEERGITCRIIPDLLEIRMGEVLIDDSLGVPTFQLKPVSLHGTAFLTKRVMDVFISSVVLGILFVPLSIIALAIKLGSAGPIFHPHDRVGYHGHSFKFMKFRSMVQNADKLLESLKAQSDRKGPVFKMKDDPRITPFGKFIRRYSLDELPQLLNVLRGDMSLVGPRPQVIWEAKAYDEWARKRLNVLPGITGLWQVSGRAELTYEEMIELDIFYIEHWSAGLDIKILLKTFPAIFLAKGAY